MLDVQVRSFFPPSDESGVEFFRQLEPESHRLRSIDVNLNDRDRVLAAARLLHGPLPNLKELSFSVRSIDSSGLITLQVDRIPALRKLSLYQVNVNWSTWHEMPFLRSLSLSGLQPPPSEDQVESILRQTPGLENLYLGDFSSDESTDDVQSEGVRRTWSPTYLPRLERLTLRRIRTGISDHLISTIQTKALHFLEVHPVHPRHLAVVGPTSNLYLHISLMMKPRHHITIDYTPYIIRLSAATYEGDRMELSSPTTEPNVTMKAFVTFANAIWSEGERLELKVKGNGQPFDATILGSLPNLTHIYVKGTGNVKNVLRFLSIPGADGRWPCPALTQIDLRDTPRDLDPSSITDFEVARYGELDGKVVEGRPQRAVINPPEPEDLYKEEEAGQE